MSPYSTTWGRPTIVIFQTGDDLVLCLCFDLLSDNESNTIRVIWYFVMLL